MYSKPFLYVFFARWVPLWEGLSLRYADFSLMKNKVFIDRISADASIHMATIISQSPDFNARIRGPNLAVEIFNS